MIDPENLRTASLYINNQLLSRGLLRDGQNIDFADPEGSDDGLQATMGRIMSVVNDLILRRDRDAEHRESLSSTMRTLRADYQRQTTEFSRQTERLCDTQRRLDIAEATERSLRAHLKSAEHGIHKLKEESAKMKSLVAQTRSACANEVRKRDRQIDSLKKAVTDAGRVRGGGRGRDIITITVTGEFDGEGNETGMPVGATEHESYSLRMETNGFLTELAKGLSEENEGLLALVRRTAEGLREMSGLDRGAGVDDGEGHDGRVRSELITRPPQKSAEELAAELEAVVEHLRSILTNPSFVPIEEVEVRDEAISRLRAGLETMESRWKDAVHMMDGWRRRMVSSGKSVDMEDLQMGLRLSPVRVRDVEETANVTRMRLSCVQEEEEEEEEEEEDASQNNQPQSAGPEPKRFRSQSPSESLRLVPVSTYDAGELGDDSGSESSIFQDDIDSDGLDDEEPNVQILQSSTAESIESSPLPEPPQISPLKDSDTVGNRGAGRNPPYRKRPGDFTTIVEENTRDLAAAEAKEAPTPPPHKSKPTSPSQRWDQTPPRVDDDDDLPIYTASYDSPLFGRSGERPSQADLSRKLFSKPSVPVPEQQPPRSVPRPKSAGNTSPSEMRSPPLSRLTRSSARKSTETSPTPSRTATTTAAAMAATTPGHTATRAATKRRALGTDPKPTPAPIITNTTATTRSQQRRAAANPSPSSPTPSTSSNNNNNTSSNTTAATSTQSRKRSPVRAQPATNATTTSIISTSSSASASSASRLARPRSAALPPPSQASPMPLNMATIAAKLAASEREADAARVRAKLKAVRRSRRISSGGVPPEGEETAAATTTTATSSTTTANAASASAPTQMTPTQAKTRAGAARASAEAREQAEGEDVDPIKKDRIAVIVVPSPLKKAPRRRWSRGPLAADDVDELALAPVEKETEEDDEEAAAQQADGEDLGLRITKRRGARRTNRVASRRRSTLSPWELQGLISGHVGGGAGGAGTDSPAR
ncbi:putative NIMA interactive protein [Rosellinia necatrix]|uniref:Putative NIMA interactive protein n=1 Tax=Rosellinia necatrix TaxID=77044 RepID=A0A1W2TCU4_ROSNE|nr:putative NIMA interactive protein [Rosellinia necatrix]